MDESTRTPEQILAGLAAHWAKQANAFEDENVVLRATLKRLLDQMDRDIGGVREGRLSELRRQARRLIEPPPQG